MQIDQLKIIWFSMFGTCATALFLIILFSVTVPAHAAEPGIESLANICTTCHGKMGVSPSPNDIPSLAGKEYDDLVRLLDEYKKNPDASHIMSRMMKPFSDSDIQLLSKYFSSL